jgi:hypothetical protein
LDYRYIAKLFVTELGTVPKVQCLQYVPNMERSDNCLQWCEFYEGTVRWACLSHLHHVHLHNPFNISYNIFNTRFCPPVLQLNQTDGHAQTHDIPCSQYTTSWKNVLRHFLSFTKHSYQVSGEKIVIHPVDAWSSPLYLSILRL